MIESKDMNTLRRYPYLATMGVCALALILFLTLTNPADVGVGLLILPAVLLFLIVFSAAQTILGAFKLVKSNPAKKRMVALVSAGLITMIMILKSTGGISVADVILLGLIILVSAVYIEKF